MELFYSVLIGYLIGGINPSYLIARARGFDIRKKGSGNAGASNAVITMGKAAGVFSALFDIFKAWFAVMLAGSLFPAFRFAREIAGTAAILGHIFPIYMQFRGGKGLACLGGVLLAYSPITFLIFLLAELILVLVTDYICVVPITASIVFPFVYGIQTGSRVGALIYGVVALVILLKHLENIRRIRNGTEVRFSYLWKREEELNRTQGKTGEPKETAEEAQELLKKDSCKQ